MLGLDGMAFVDCNRTSAPLRLFFAIFNMCPYELLRCRSAWLSRPPINMLDDGK